MAIRLTPFEIDRWNSDDQAIATLGDAHWDHFFTERRHGKYGVESRKHKAWRKGLYVLERAAAHLHEHSRTENISAL